MIGTLFENRLVTGDKIRKIVPLCRYPDDIARIMNLYLPAYGITSKEQVAMFIAQTAHESGNYNVVRENLNYSASGLRKVFPKYFPTQAMANSYARKPEKIASRVYANRMGNGNEASGDGWKYRGRGFIQLTGKTNYSLFAKDMHKPLDEIPEFLETYPGAMLGALWFWHRNGLRNIKDIRTVTKKINGGYKGLSGRSSYYKRAMSVL